MIRFTQKQKRFMCERIARFVKRSDLIDECIRAFTLDDTPPMREKLYRTIDYLQGHPNALRWQQLIEQTRTEWLADVHAVPLANRKMRILEMARFYERCTERLAACEDPFEEDKLAASALKILKQIREEADALLAIRNAATRDGEGEATTGFEDLSNEELIETARAAGIHVAPELEHSLESATAPRPARIMEGQGA